MVPALVSMLFEVSWKTKPAKWYYDFTYSLFKTWCWWFHVKCKSWVAIQTQQHHFEWDNMLHNLRWFGKSFCKSFCNQLVKTRPDNSILHSIFTKLKKDILQNPIILNTILRNFQIKPGLTYGLSKQRYIFCPAFISFLSKNK